MGGVWLNQQQAMERDHTLANTARPTRPGCSHPANGIRRSDPLYSRAGQEQFPKRSNPPTRQLPAIVPLRGLITCTGRVLKHGIRQVASPPGGLPPQPPFVQVCFRPCLSAERSGAILCGAAARGSGLPPARGLGRRFWLGSSARQDR